MADYDIIASRRSQFLKDKTGIWTLTRDSYAGGEQYRQGNHLIRYYRESTASYKSRTNRATYINHVQPLSDIMAGFLYQDEPARQLPTWLDYLMQDASAGRSFDEVIQSIAIQSMLYPVFVLVDVPAFNREEVRTRADREALRINPFLTIYNYNEIRDYDVDDHGHVNWVLLDNSYVDGSSPLVEAKKVTRYRLWTRESFQDFIIHNHDGKIEVIPQEEVFHRLNRVPGVFVGLKTLNDHPDANVFESIALLSKNIYNLLSLLDETLYGSSFSTLFFPLKAGEELPETIKTQGIGALVVVPFSGDLSQRPFFEGAGQVNVEPFMTTIKLLTREIFRQVGFSIQEEDSRFWSESGVAKSVEFKKTEALLRLLSTQMEQVETEIFTIAALWEGQQPEIKVTYSSNFEHDALDAELSRLYSIMAMPYAAVQKAAAKRIISKVFDDLDSKEEKDIRKEVESSEPFMTVKPAEEVAPNEGAVGVA